MSIKVITILYLNLYIELHIKQMILNFKVGK